MSVTAASRCCCCWHHDDLEAGRSQLLHGGQVVADPPALGQQALDKPWLNLGLGKAATASCKLSYRMSRYKSPAGSATSAFQTDLPLAANVAARTGVPAPLGVPLCWCWVRAATAAAEIPCVSVLSALRCCARVHAPQLAAIHGRRCDNGAEKLQLQPHMLAAGQAAIPLPHARIRPGHGAPRLRHIV